MKAIIFFSIMTFSIIVTMSTCDAQRIKFYSIKLFCKNPDELKMLHEKNKDSINKKNQEIMEISRRIENLRDENKKLKDNNFKIKKNQKEDSIEIENNRKISENEIEINTLNNNKIQEIEMLEEFKKNNVFTILNNLIKEIPKATLVNVSDDSVTKILAIKAKKKDFVTIEQLLCEYFR